MFFLKESARERVEKARRKGNGYSGSIKYFVNPDGCFIVYNRCFQNGGYILIKRQTELTWKTESLIEQILLHRLIYKSYYGDIPDGMVVRHKCDNPTCINPLHLELGTRGDNAHDCKIRDRGKSLKNLAINQIWTDVLGGKNGKWRKGRDVLYMNIMLPLEGEVA